LNDVFVECYVCKSYFLVGRVLIVKIGTRVFFRSWSVIVFGIDQRDTSSFPSFSVLERRVR